MKFKYIMLEQQIAGIIRAVPFLFFEPITHIDMFRAALRLPEMRGAKLRSAGFVTISTRGIECSGESESLKARGEQNCKALPDDEVVILHYNYMHGILS